MAVLAVLLALLSTGGRVAPRSTAEAIRVLDDRYGQPESEEAVEGTCPLASRSGDPLDVEGARGKFTAMTWTVDDAHQVTVYFQNGEMVEIWFHTTPTDSPDPSMMYYGAGESGWVMTDIEDVLSETGWSEKIGEMLACDSVWIMGGGRLDGNYYYERGTASVDVTDTVPGAGRGCPPYRNVSVFWA